MPRTKSAKKQMRQAVGRTARNRQQRSALRTAIKKLRSLVDPKEGKAAFLEAEKQLDRASRKGLIHRNTAARQKSRLAKRVKK
ncbi:MAG TPA: 30S ribosomal protein S20 [Gemmatimonadales bacterium]